MLLCDPHPYPPAARLPHLASFSSSIILVAASCSSVSLPYITPPTIKILTEHRANYKSMYDINDSNDGPRTLCMFVGVYRCIANLASSWLFRTSRFKGSLVSDQWPVESHRPAKTPAAYPPGPIRSRAHSTSPKAIHPII